MFQLLSILCILSNIIVGSSNNNHNDGLKNAIKAAIKYKDDDIMWHGHDVADGEYPFVVSVVFIEEPVVTRHCSGSLIHSTWVLSSSHCFYDLLDSKFYIWYGNFTVSPLVSNLYSAVLNITIHPDFFNTKFFERGFFFGDNDISLLKVEKIRIAAYGRLSNIDHTKMYGLSVKYIGGAARNFGTGWKYVGGLRKKTGAFVKNKNLEEFKPMQIGEGIVINCGMELTIWSKHVLCIAPKCSDRLHQPLHGDFGGPFIFKGKIVGVMSLSFKLPKTFLSSNGLTPVNPYKVWINRVISKE